MSKEIITITDDITEKEYKVRVREDNDSIRMFIQGGPANGAFDHVAMEVHDGFLKVHLWTDGVQAPDSLSVSLEDLFDEDNDTPNIMYAEGDC